MYYIDILNGNALKLRKYIRCFLHQTSNLLFSNSIVLFRSTCWRFNFVLVKVLYFILSFLYLIVASVWLLYIIGAFFVIVMVSWVSIFILFATFDLCILLTSLQLIFYCLWMKWLIRIIVLLQNTLLCFNSITRKLFVLNRCKYDPLILFRLSFDLGLISIFNFAYQWIWQLQLLFTLLKYLFFTYFIKISHFVLILFLCGFMWIANIELNINRWFLKARIIIKGCVWPMFHFKINRILFGVQL